VQALPSSQGQSAAQVLQFSPQSISHIPSPQLGVMTPSMQVLHRGVEQSDAQVLQFSPHSGSHVLLPQLGAQSHASGLQD